MFVLRHIRRPLVLGVFLGHAALAIGWWRLMPGGFPVSHVRFWLNVVGPIATLAVSVLGLWALRRERTSWSTACLGVLRRAALSAAAGTRLVMRPAFIAIEW